MLNEKKLSNKKIIDIHNFVVVFVRINFVPFAEIVRVYSGTVAGAREAFFNGIPAVSVSYNWYSSVNFLSYCVSCREQHHYLVFWF